MTLVRSPNKDDVGLNGWAKENVGLKDFCMDVYLTHDFGHFILFTTWLLLSP